MSVAKSYTQYKIDGEPFIENGKTYVNIIMPKGLKKVRWYPEAEDNILKFSQKHAFGFDRGGYITVFYGDEQKIKDWRSTLPAWTIWHNTFFGYFMPPYNHFDGILPDGIQAKQIFWDDVRDTTDKSNKLLKDSSWIIQYINGLFITTTTSKFQGAINDWLEREIEITNKEDITNHFGTSHIYTMADNDKNEYIWQTSSKNLEENQRLHMRMKVKDHKINNGINQTIVYYCKII